MKTEENLMEVWEKELTAQRRTAKVKVTLILSGLCLYLVSMFGFLVGITPFVKGLLGVE